MIQFLKKVYLTSFAILFRCARVKGFGYKVGNSIVPIVFVQALLVLGVFENIEILSGHRFRLAVPLVIGVTMAIFLLNLYILAMCGHGVKFAREFENLKKMERGHIDR